MPVFYGCPSFHISLTHGPISLLFQHLASFEFARREVSDEASLLTWTVSLAFLPYDLRPPLIPKKDPFIQNPSLSSLMSNSLRIMALRTILITGSTDGIGKQTALELAKNPDNHLIIHGRDERRCKDTVEMIKSTSGIAADRIDYVVADFARMQSVRSLVDEVERRFARLNVLVCNAGVLLRERQMSEDNLEMTFQVNHLAHFLLATKLGPLLKRNRPSRVIVVSSICHSWHEIDWDDLMAEKQYEKYVQYSRSKLMNHLFTFALARRFAADNDVKMMTANVLEPGVIETKLLRAGGYSGSPVEQGARTEIYLAQSKEVDGVNGQYFDNATKRIEPWKKSRNEVDQEKLWKISESMCEQLGVW